MEEIAKNCVDIATNQCGCSVMQKLMSHAGEEAIAKLVDSIISNAEVLAEDQYGFDFTLSNYLSYLIANLQFICFSYSKGQRYPHMLYPFLRSIVTYYFVLIIFHNINI